MKIAKFYWIEKSFLEVLDSPLVFLVVKGHVRVVVGFELFLLLLCFVFCLFFLLFSLLPK